MTRDQAQKHLDAWLAADLACSTGQSYTIGSRSLTRANITEIRKQIEYWQHKVNALAITESGGRIKRARRFIPRDL